MGLFDPRIDRHLISDLGEFVVDEVRKHGAAIVGAVLELLGGLVVAVLAVMVPPPAWWLPVVTGGALVLHACWRILEQRMDRFVITNMRVFRVHGILSQRIATMPLTRILDISVHKPIVGRMLGFGHFVFESAAQEQGLREIRFVGDPDERGLTIQRVIQQAGLRGAAGRHDSAQGIPATAEVVAARPSIPVVTPRPAPRRRDDPDEAAPGWEWLALARRREEERLGQLRGEVATGPIPTSDRATADTTPIDFAG